MGYSRKLGPPIVSAAVATIVLTNFAIVTIVKSDTRSGIELFGAIWPIALTSAVAIIFVMSFLYHALLDLVHELETREATAQHIALHDQLTGLANRALLEDRLDQVLNRQRRDGEKIALLVLDLDRFKQVNDTLGHNAGDLLVQLVAGRLKALLGESDTVARIGGDEFAIIQQGVRGEGEVRRLCAHIIETVSEPFMLGGREARVGVSVGAVLESDDVDEASELIRRADITMYRAKAAGRDCYRLFSDEMDAAVQRRDQVESGLRLALASERELDLHYQPLVDRHGAVVGLEGLLRWEHPELGWVPPSDVIPVAEECGLIDALGEFVFRRACRTARAWPLLAMAVNLSPLQFRSEGFAARLADIAAGEGVDCDRIQLEITENLMIEHGDVCETGIQELRARGFGIALDDFGTGYSSLSYLRRFQVDRIKLDRSFIDSAAQGNSVAIIRAAVTLGHAMGLEVVAEGISGRAQEHVALQAGCDFFQGYLYAAAMPAEALESFLQTQGTRLAANA